MNYNNMKKKPNEIVCTVWFYSDGVVKQAQLNWKAYVGGKPLRKAGM